jgi:aspartate/methionine/tyrosine aminotransferase
VQRRRVSRLESMLPIGVDRVGDIADAAADPEVLRLENLDTDIPPLPAAIAATRRAAARDAANSYLPFAGYVRLRRAVATHVAHLAGVDVDWSTQCLISAGGLNGILNVLLAMVEPGDEVVLTDPTYIGLINRVRLAGAIPRFATLRPTPSGWQLDHDSLRAALTDRSRAMLLMSPSMPSGCVFDREDWRLVAELCIERDLWLIDDAAMERILFDDRPLIHPASFPGMPERTIIVGSASKELRMIGWRVGWVVAPPSLANDIALVGISNVVCQVGIAQDAVAIALEAGDANVATATAELQARRDAMMAELEDLPVIPPHGGWSMLLDAATLGRDAEEASMLLLDRAKVAATPMTGWGERAARYVRFVYANEPAERLRGLGERVRRAFA